MKKDKIKFETPKAPKTSKSEMSGGNIPPSLQETTEKLLADAKNLSSNTPAANSGNENVSDAPRKRGRPKGSTNKPKESNLPAIPVEGLIFLHKGIWDGIANALHSDYRLSEKGAKEMGDWASICIKQYVGPIASEHFPLMMYCLTQITALGVCIAMRRLKDKKTLDKSPVEGESARMG